MNWVWWHNKYIDERLWAQELERRIWEKDERLIKVERSCGPWVNIIEEKKTVVKQTREKNERKTDQSQRLNMFNFFSQQTLQQYGVNMEKKQKKQYGVNMDKKQKKNNTE